MRELDFLFIYEHKVRELENLCLMKYELDRRGYRTEIAYINDADNALQPRPVIHTKVLCTMACYWNPTLKWHAKEFVKFDKVIDLQWENIVYPKDEEREDAYKNYWGIGKEVVHLSWGKQNVDRLLNAAHIDPKKIKLTGHVGMDFLRSPLNRYYVSRDEWLARYNIDTTQKVILFASPFYGDQLSEEYIADMCMRFGEDWRNYYSFMCKSQSIILEWFERLCISHPEIVMIFRPHPGHPSMKALEMQKKLNNFKVIADASVKQWIIACDKIYTGNSSVVVEAYFAQKDCQILCPIPITNGFELKLIENSKKIVDYEGLLKNINDSAPKFPTPDSAIEEIYLIDWDKFSYLKFADMAEEVLKDDYYKLSAKQLRDYKEYTFGEKLIHFMSKIAPLYNIYLNMVKNTTKETGLLAKQKEIRENNTAKAYKLMTDNAHELTTKEEIQSIINRIAKAIEN